MARKLILKIILLTFISIKSIINYADTYSVDNTNILQNGITKTWRGANAMHVFGGNSNDMNVWNANIVREFIGDAKNTPITGWAVNINGAWFHPLEKYISSNRANGKVTILTPFGWNGTSFTGKNPSQQIFYNDYKAKMREWANYIKNQPDVWIEVWNEPYMWDNTNYPLDHSLWLADMIDMVDNIRGTGCNNIILVPGNKQGQGEDPILNKAQELLSGRANIVFDLHAYEKWLKNASLESIQTRLSALKQKNVAILFGEIAPYNATTLTDPSNFLKAARQQNISTLAWLWKYNGADRNALFDAYGAVNNNNNNSWGSLFTEFLINPHTFSASIGQNAGYAGDKDINTYWTTGTAQTADQFFKVGFGLSRSWSHIKLDMGSQYNDYPRSYTLYSSDDGVNWNYITTGTGTPYSTDIWVDTQTSKWIRIGLDNLDGNIMNPWSIAEITVDIKNNP